MIRDAPPPSRRRLRLLSDEEIALWVSVTKSVTPRPDAVLPVAKTPTPEPAKEAPKSPHVAQQTPAPRIPHPPRLAPLDWRQRQRLSRGRMGVDAVFDLHGFTQAEAHSALHNFLLGAQSRGARLVLVVTGKGEGRPTTDYGTGILRRTVPHWLAAPDWRGLVVGFEEASRPHGGAGALYVRLRRHDRR